MMNTDWMIVCKGRMCVFAYEVCSLAEPKWREQWATYHADAKLNKKKKMMLLHIPCLVPQPLVSMVIRTLDYPSRTSSRAS